MRTLALYAGSFNPIHAGHIFVINVANQIFGEDSVKVVLADNPKKHYLVSKEQRSEWIWETTGKTPLHTDGFVCDFCDNYMRVHNLSDGEQIYDQIVLIRGVRTLSDLEVEMPMAGYNYNITHGKYPTIFIPCPADLRDLSSSAVRVISKRNWDDFWKLLYEPFPPKNQTYEKWMSISKEIWKTYSSLGEIK